METSYTAYRKTTVPKFSSLKNNFITDPPWCFKRKYMKDYEVLWHYSDGDISGSVDGD